MNENDFETKRWQLFLQICDKRDLDLKGEEIHLYKENFVGAFKKAHNIATFYKQMINKVDNIENDNNE